MPTDTWRTQLDLNVTSAFVCTKVVGGEMVKRRSGRIVNVASISGMIANRGIAGRGYEAGKAALAAFTRAVAADWAPYGVNVNAIAPGVFLTDPNRRWFDEDPELKETIESMVPMGRLGEPREIAPLALYLASDASSFMTGAVIVIDGGYTLW
jgi:gluconate 5-dehydrogenase